MKKVYALIDCSLPINPRNQKIIDSIKLYNPNADVHIITWYREGKTIEQKQYLHAYNRVAPYADVKAKMQGMLGFKKYIGCILEQIKPEVIIASHWSNLVLVSGFKKQNQILIYDNLDIPTGRSIIRAFSCFLERRSLKKVDLIIHASRFFRPLYKQNIAQVVLENKPLFSPNLKKSSVGYPIKVAFIGSVRYKDILMNLVDAVKGSDKYELYFHGYGEDVPAMKEYCKNYKNVFFTGPYKHSDLISLYHNSDIIWAGYPNKDYNVVYAISNKFHESIYTGVPCIFSSNTELAAYVKNENIGFVVDPYSPKDIKNLLEDISNGSINVEIVKESMKRYLSNESSWDDDFKEILKYLD